MIQRPIVAHLSLKGMPAREIHDDIAAILGPDAVSYSSVTRYHREARFPSSKPEPHPADVQRDLDDSDQATLTACEEFTPAYSTFRRFHTHNISILAHPLHRTEA
jgi:hypothetical protein